MTGAALWIVLDLLAAVVGAAAWLGAGAAATTGRVRATTALLATAVAATAGRVVTVVGLAGEGWWFVQEKALLTLPAQVVAGAVAVVLAARHRAGHRVVVSSLTAGYAAVVGIGVTVLFGYPLTWTVGLGSLSLVGLGALITARAVTAGPARSRRWLAAGAGAMAVVGAGLVFVPAPTMDHGGGPAGAAAGSAAVPVDSLRGPAGPAPGGEIRRFTLTARQAQVRLASGRTIEAWTYNGQVPGPALTAVEGDLLEVTLRNDDIHGGVTLHWHGYEVPAGEDGAPGLTQAAVAPGEEFTYRFRAEQVGTYWYHTHQSSHIGVRKGLYGTLVVTGRAETSGVDLVVPVHTFDGSTVFGDRDQPWTRRVARGTPVRLRLVNTDSTPHRFTLAGTAYRLVAVDGRDLREPGEVRDVVLRLPAGGRYDLAFPMPAGPVTLAAGDTTGLRLLADGEAGEGGADGEAGAEPDTGGWPELDLLDYGAPGGGAGGGSSGDGFGEEFDRDFTLVLDRGLAMVDGVPRFAQTVNGRAYPNIPTQLVAAGDLVRFTVVNRSLQTHPWHLHGHTVRVLSRDGRQPTGSPLWVDTFDVRPGEVWQVGFRAENPGWWMNHCHNLPHAEQGMMLHLAYDGISTPYHDHGR